MDMNKLQRRVRLGLANCVAGLVGGRPCPQKSEMNNDGELSLDRIGHTDEDVTGVCPQCGGFDTYYNVGRRHWVVCHHHQLKWLAGENLPYFIRDNDTPEEWERNRQILERYAEAKPGDRGLPQVPFEVSWAVDALLAELWDAEARDYSNASPREKEWHIFRHLYVLDRWLNGKPFDLPPRTHIDLDDN